MGGFASSQECWQSLHRKKLSILREEATKKWLVSSSARDSSSRPVNEIFLFFDIMYQVHYKKYSTMYVRTSQVD